MKHKKQKETQLITNPTDALAVVQKTAEKIVVRSANKERGIKAKHASFADGVVWGMSGRMLSKKKFEEAFAKVADDKTLSAVYAKMQGNIDSMGVDAMKRSIQAVQDGKRKVTRVFANLANGRVIVETLTTNKQADVEAVVAETKIGGKPAVDSEKAEAIARNLSKYGLV